ncbi:MAG: lysylphosphatidylglycerol synthase transmembrane domain-containing protein [Myxococcaceae bacterium]
MDGERTLELEAGALRRRRPRWRAGSWLFGAALLAAVVIFSTRLPEEREFALVVQRSAPGWLALAALLQAATYLAQAAVWKVVLARTRFATSLWDLYKMSVAKLFVDQAIPSAGISGTLLIVRGLEQRRVDRGPVMACVVIETITNFAAFVLALLLALGLAAWLGEASAPVWIASAAFVAFWAGLITLLVFLARGRPLRVPRLVLRVPGVRVLLDALAQAPPALAYRPRLLAEGTGLNFAIHLLDAATMWVLLRALGVQADPSGVFAAFMLSTLARTVGVVPGGLGTFEAASVGTLKLMGVPIPAALAATLLFRGFSFWIPLIPGLVLSRFELRDRGL